MQYYHACSKLAATGLDCLLLFLCGDAAMEARGLKLESHTSSQPEKGFPITKVPEKSIREGVPDQQGVPEIGFPVGFLI